MSRFVVEFMKNVLGGNGRQSEICQSTLEVDATDQDEAAERAKQRFCKDQMLCHWSLHADRIQVKAADLPSGLFRTRNTRRVRDRSYLYR